MSEEKPKQKTSIDKETLAIRAAQYEYNRQQLERMRKLQGLEEEVAQGRHK